MPMKFRFQSFNLLQFAIKFVLSSVIAAWKRTLPNAREGKHKGLMRIHSFSSVSFMDGRFLVHRNLLDLRHIGPCELALNYNDVMNRDATQIPY